MTKQFERVFRERRLTPEELAADEAIRQKVQAELRPAQSPAASSPGSQNVNSTESRRGTGAFRTASAGMLLLVGSLSIAAEPVRQPAGPPEAGKVRIAVVQQETVPGAVDDNRAKALRFAREALRNHAGIVLFHEALLVGYVPRIRELAEPADGRTTQAFQELLRGTDALILYGLVERDGADCYTSAVLVSADGLKARYRKTHLWWKADGARHEPTFFRAGDELVTFSLKGHKCGVMICYDGDFPEMTRAYANQGCLLLFWLNNRGCRGYQEVAPLVRANTMIMATACCCGKNENGTPCRGGSNITDKDAALLTEIWDKEGVIYADVDPRTVPEARQQNPWFRGQRQDLYRPR
jgi:predicted amidohydrolase